METHANHLHNAPGKKFLHYFFEFFMLFLAVSAGFFAENLRDNYVDSQRETQYMKSLQSDLRTDGINIDSVITKDEETKVECDSLFQLLSLPDHAGKTDAIYFNGRKISLRYFFYMTDGTLKQLNNAGGLRLIHHSDLVDSIQAYENAYAEIERSQQLKEQQLTDYRNACEKVFNVSVFEEMLKGTLITYPAGNPKLFSENKEDINALLILAHYIKRNNSNIIQHLQNLRQRSINIQALIKEKYNVN